MRLKTYSPALAKKTKIVALSKADLVRGIRIKKDCQKEN